VSDGTAATPAARAEALIDLDRHAEAIPLLQRALTSSPEDEWLLDLLAQAQLEVEPASALVTARRLIGLDPDGHRGHLLAALAAGKAGLPRDAERHAREAVRTGSFDPNAHAVLAQSLVDRKHKLREAMRHAKQAIDLAPHASVGYVTAGNVELRRAHARRADLWYRRALDVAPTDRTAQANLALARSVRGRVADALSDADALLRVDPQDEWARHVLDGAVYTTLVHLQWVAFVAAVVAAMFRIG
jgi:tetratricopeptide (TPR) repeat protein